MAPGDDVRRGQTAVFMDRDGVIVRDVHYLCDPARLELLPRAGEAIRRVNEAGRPAIVITNQSAVARGLCTEDDLKRIHARLESMLDRDGAHLDAIYTCPHHPDFPYRGVTDCRCRKPAPGMLARACRDFAIDPKQSVFVGDSPTDVQAARRAGMRPILVAPNRQPPGPAIAAPDLVICPSLLDAVELVLKE